MTQTDLNICWTEVFHRADAELDRLYAELLAAISPKGKDMLRAAERAWLDYRDKECEFETAGFEGGTIHAMLEAQCMIASTKRRIQELEAQRNCNIGDLCGGQ